MEETRNRLHPETHVISNKIKIKIKMEVPSLPPETILEILKRLPVKSLLRFRCVSKSWLHLISSSEFIKTHLDYSTSNPNFTNHRILHTVTNLSFNLKHSSVHSLLFEDAIVAFDTDFPEKYSHKRVSVVGSCNGLICIVIGKNDVFLWNPTLRTSNKLPPLAVENTGGYRNNLWRFGFNECDDDYKVVGIVYMFSAGKDEYEHESVVKIFSLKYDSWKRIEGFTSGFPLCAPGKYASGKLHFAACPWIGIDYHRTIIVSLDLKSEVYGIVEQPDYGVRPYDQMLGVLGGCVCVLNYFFKIRSDVWVLKEYNVKESWTKLISIPYINDPGIYVHSNPLLVLPSGEVLLVFEGHFVVYNPKDNSFRRPEITNANRVMTADVYVESLVSL